MNLQFTYEFDKLGRTAITDDVTHIRNLIEQVLFTSPGERVNRPGFGSGLLQLVFQPNSPESAATTQFLVQGALNQWLGDLIEVNQVEIRAEDARLEVDIAYTIRKTQEQQIAQFIR